MSEILPFPQTRMTDPEHQIAALLRIESLALMVQGGLRTRNHKFHAEDIAACAAHLRRLIESEHNPKGAA